PERRGAQSAEITLGRSNNRYQEVARNGRPLATGASQDIPPELSVPLVLENMPPAAGGQPMTVGLPFPKGVLRRIHCLQLTDSAGQLIPLQARALSQWSDG